MNDACKDLGGRFAEKIVKNEYSAAREFLAPWLRESFSEEELKSLIQSASQELPAPGAFTLDGNSCTLNDLEVDEYSPPTKSLPPEITSANFRQWMVIEFKPDPKLETGYDACFDLWMALVEMNGAMKIGYMKPAGAD